MKRELIIEERFGGSLTYANRGMRHRDEEEIFYLEKDDKVYIIRKQKAKKGGKHE